MDENEVKGTVETEEKQVVYVQHVQRETTKSPIQLGEYPYRAKMHKGYTDSWYHPDAPESDESDLLPGEDDTAGDLTV